MFCRCYLYLLFLWCPNFSSRTLGISISSSVHTLTLYDTFMCCSLLLTQPWSDITLLSCWWQLSTSNKCTALSRCWFKQNNGEPSGNKKPSPSNVAITVCDAGITRKVVLLVYFKMKFFSSEKHSLSSAMKNCYWDLRLSSISR